MRILINDHNPDNRKKLQSELEGYSLLAHIDQASNGIEAIESINRNAPDLAFIDVNMPILGGFEILPHLKHKPLLVFCSENADDALQSFENHAFDFLVKPFLPSRLAQCLTKLKAHKKLFHHMDTRRVQLNKLICIKNQVRHVVWLEEVLLFRKDGRYTEILTRRGEHYHLKRSLDDLETNLSHPDFFRVNRAAILAKRSVQSFRAQSSGRGRVTLTTGETCPVSRHRRPQFRNWLEN